MVHITNMLTCYFLLHLYKLSIVMSDSTTIVHMNPGDEALLNCSESSFIMIRTVSVQNNSYIPKCESNQCNLTSDDHDLINECEGSLSCYIDGSLLTSACLWQNLHFDISYTCQPEERYLYDGCYVDDTYRVLDEDYKDNDEMSAEICFKICTESQNWKEHVYFGTQYAKECYCGNGTELGHEPYVKRETECTTPCLKHEGETCGGNYRMSVYQMTKRHYKYSCLDMYQDHAIEECAANHLQIESLCIKFDDSLENENLGCSDMGNKLYDFCRRQHPNRKCDFNMKNFTKATNENQPSRSISIEYLCKEQNLARSSTKSRLTTGTVVGTVVGSVLFLCLVFIGIFIGRRFLFCDKLNKKLKNNPETNDYVGNQNIALPQAVRPTTRNVQYEDLQNTSGNISTHNYSCTNVHSQNINDKYGYAKNIEKNKSKTFNDTTSTPTYVVLKNDSYNPNLDANNDEYAVVDPTAEPSFKHAQNNTTPGPENYMILDPSQTGFNRTKFPNDDQAYKLANYISDTRSHKYDVYALSPEGTYDHSGITRHRKDQDTIYTHTVDNVYDSASRGVNIARKEDTYDHFFGKRTEDEYNIAMH